jgi:hypothetical protein
MLVGIGFLALVTGAVAERFLRRRIVEVQEDAAETELLEEEIVEAIEDIRLRLDALEAMLARR